MSMVYKCPVCGSYSTENQRSYAVHLRHCRKKYGIPTLPIVKKGGRKDTKSSSVAVATATKPTDTAVGKIVEPKKIVDKLIQVVDHPVQKPSVEVVETSSTDVQPPPQQPVEVESEQVQHPSEIEQTAPPPQPESRESAWALSVLRDQVDGFGKVAIGGKQPAQQQPKKSIKYVYVTAPSGQPGPQYQYEQPHGQQNSGNTSTGADALMLSLAKALDVGGDWAKHRLGITASGPDPFADAGRTMFTNMMVNFGKSYGTSHGKHEGSKDNPAPDEDEVTFNRRVMADAMVKFIGKAAQDAAERQQEEKPQEVTSNAEPAAEQPEHE